MREIIKCEMPTKSTFINLLALDNKEYGRLEVSKYEGKQVVNGQTRHFWLCKCSCGGEIVAHTQSLKQGAVLSCGCFNKEQVKKACTTHGMTNTRIYQTWKDMRQRCNNPLHKEYKNYGGRGIQVCERWNVFENFYEDMKDKSSPDLTLERENNDGNYCKENCVWGTWEEQENNKRINTFLEFNGERLTIAQWARKIDINERTIHFRLKSGWSIEKTLTTQVDTKYRRKKNNA